MDLVTFQNIVRRRASPRLFVAFDLYHIFEHRKFFHRCEALGVHNNRKLVERSLHALCEAGLVEKDGITYKVVPQNGERCVAECLSAAMLD